MGRPLTKRTRRALQIANRMPTQKPITTLRQQAAWELNRAARLTHAVMTDPSLSRRPEDKRWAVMCLRGDLANVHALNVRARRAIGGLPA